MGLNEIIKIGDNIKLLRKNLKLTQSDMAEKVGIPRSTYAHYENNTREPDIETLKKISEVLDVSINDMIQVPDIDEDKKSDIVFEFWDSGINTREKPTVAEMNRHDTAIYKAIFNMMKDKDIQQEFDYIYDDLRIQESSSISQFILGMLKLKIDDIKDIRITYGIKGVLEIEKDETLKNKKN